ncbi:MAG: hypothetical protein ABR525_09255 [Candidatus Limnocylindria bacterium]
MKTTHDPASESGPDESAVPAYADLPLFDGYPYLVTALLGSLHHLIVLPGDLRAEELLPLGRRQHLANRLRTCLVLGPDAAVYFGDDGETVGEPPRCTNPITDRLLCADAGPLTEELEQRQRRLRAFCADSPARGGQGFLMDRMRGRPATREDLVRLSRPDVDGVPVGLARCDSCSAFRGEYIPGHAPGLVVRVFCRCENHNLCARCSGRLNEHRLEAAFFDEEERRVWHVPAFCALSHACPIVLVS